VDGGDVDVGDVAVIEEVAAFPATPDKAVAEVAVGNRGLRGRTDKILNEIYPGLAA
jgi:hypothetical protein